MTDYEQQLQLARERALRYGQQAQYQAPQGRMVGNIYVAPNPLEYLAAGLRSLGGMRGQQMAQEEITQIGSEREKALANALRGFTEKALGRPAEVLPPDVAGPPRPAEPQDMPGAYRALMGAPDAGYRQMAMQGISRIPELEAAAAQRVEDRAFRQQEAETARQARMDQLRFQQESRMAELQARNASAAEQAEMQRQFQREMVELRRSMQPQQQGYYQFIGTPQGIAVGNARTGELSLGSINGQPVIKASDDPTLQGSLAGAKAAATTEAKMRTESRLEAPKAITQGEETIRLVDDLLNAPGMKQAVGASRLLGIQKIPGTPAKDFDIRLDQLKGQQFLQAFESLKGGGAITEVEGKKATDAIARMDAAGSEAEFTKAAREFQSVIRQGVARAKNAQGVQTIQPAQTTPPNELFNAADAILNRGKK
ncbi:MAG: hypothetical protein IM328_12350 [Microcystis sp. M034S1]|jgi:hypothetical protein|uniref:hypothetical protein n=1 Tax=Microcystis sp. M034S1 TaxID=2771111 RepID=UPI002586FADF|nr:hypothetical protein [Microcystis sp. M034S1]MCA2910124.1 hypothetical protein [Microcystis sp. M034S1]